MVTVSLRELQFNILVFSTVVNCCKTSHRKKAINTITPAVSRRPASNILMKKRQTQFVVIHIFVFGLMKWNEKMLNGFYVTRLRKAHRQASRWKRMRRWRLTYCGSLLTVSARALGVEDPDHFVKPAVELRAIWREAQRVSCRQLVQVIVGSEAGSHLPVKCIPHMDGVVTATAG